MHRLTSETYSIVHELDLYKNKGTWSLRLT